MERVYGFNFDDVVGMQDAGINTEEVVRTAMIAFMEGAVVEGIFHGDLHGGNLFVVADGRTALLDYGIVARLSEERRNAFLRLMLGATSNDVRTQMAALRDLGALPMDTDLEAVITDLRLDDDVIDPTTLSGEEMVKEVQRVVKALLGYGAKLPKELMLYVKELGVEPNSVEFDPDGVRASLGLTPDVEHITYRELQARRELIQKRMRDHVESERAPAGPSRQ